MLECDKFAGINTCEERFFDYCIMVHNSLANLHATFLWLVSEAMLITTVLQ